MLPYVKADNYNGMLSNLVTGENRPEIIMFDVGSYYENKDMIFPELLDLSDIGLDLGAVSENAIAAESVDGKLRSLPWGILATGFVVNTTLLDSLGLSIPQTHEQFDSVCETLVEKGYTPIQDFYEQVMNNDLKHHIAVTDGKESYYDMFAEVKGGCGELFLDEFTAMLEMTEKNFISSEINNSIPDNYEGNILHFFEGETPFLCFSTEEFSGMKKRESKSEAFMAEPLEYEFVSLPISSDEPVLSESFLPGLSVVSGSDGEEWAKEFMRFICSTDELDLMAYTKGFPSASASADTDPRYLRINSLPAERVIMPYENELSAIVDENSGYTH